MTTRRKCTSFHKALHTRQKKQAPEKSRKQIAWSS